MNTKFSLKLQQFIMQHLNYLFKINLSKTYLVKSKK